MSLKLVTPGNRRPSRTKSFCLALFSGVRTAQRVARQVPGALLEARNDVVAAWRESGNASPNVYGKTMIETGFVVFLDVALILWKLPRRLMLKLLAHDVALDLTVSVLVLIIHWGTFSGVMAATVAGLLMSLATSGAKRLFGYILSNRYVPGVIHLKD